MTFMPCTASPERRFPSTVFQASTRTLIVPVEVIEESMSMVMAAPSRELPVSVSWKNNLILSTGTLLLSVLSPNAVPVTWKFSFAVTEVGASTSAMTLSVVTEEPLSESQLGSRSARPRSAILKASNSMRRMKEDKRSEIPTVGRKP